MMGEELYGLNERIAEAVKLADNAKDWTGQAQRSVAQAQVMATIAVAESIERLTDAVEDLRRHGLPIEDVNR
jgi:uncharacterized protein with PhoU and TrkA domain